MTEYKTPLPGMLALALETAINQVLHMDKESPGRVKKLENRLLQVDLEGLGITLFFTFKYGNARVRLEAEQAPDAVISGTPIALFSMAEPEDENWGLPDSKVKINGDASLARDLERIFSKLDPEWEAPLIGMLGETAGYQLAQGIRQGVGTAMETARTARKILSGFMQDRNK
jgi:ubiquinone biosynthesis protein UbiJ